MRKLITDGFVIFISIFASFSVENYREASLEKGVLNDAVITLGEEMVSNIEYTKEHLFQVRNMEYLIDEVIKNYETITLEKAYEIHNNNPFIHTFNIEGEIEYYKKYDDNFSILSYWNAWEPEKVFFESMLYSGKLLEIKNKKIRKEIESIYTKQQERVSGMTDITKNNSNKIGNWFELTRDKYSFDTTNKSIFQNDKDQKLKNMLVSRRGILKSRIIDTENYLQGLQNIVLLISSEYKKLD